MQKKKFVRIAAVILIFTFAAVLIFELHRSIPTAGEMVTETENDRKFIKWVEFDVSYSALSKALELDIKNHDSPTPTDWITLLACLGAKYGGDFSHFSKEYAIQLISSPTKNACSTGKVSNRSRKR